LIQAHCQWKLTIDQRNPYFVIVSISQDTDVQTQCSRNCIIWLMLRYMLGIHDTSGWNSDLTETDGIEDFSRRYFQRIDKLMSCLYTARSVEPIAQNVTFKFAILKSILNVKLISYIWIINRKSFATFVTFNRKICIKQKRARACVCVCVCECVLHACMIMYYKVFYNIKVSTTRFVKTLHLINLWRNTNSRFH